MLSYRLIRIIPLLLLASLLAACSSASSGAVPAAVEVLSPPVEAASEEAAAGAYTSSSSVDPAPIQEPGQPAASSPAWDTSAPQNDSQGPIEVAITPLNLEAPGETLDFEVVLDTHSVDLSMDLAPLAALQTDSGLAAPALLWDAPRGGHHVGGILSFPTAVEGVSLLESAAEIQIVISGLEAPQRVFTWQRR